MKIAAHAAPDAKVRVLDLVTGRELWTAKAGDENVLAVAFSPDGKILATGAGFVEPIIRLWDVASGQEIGRLEGHRVYSGQLLFLPGGKTLASAGADQTIRLWDVASRRLLQTLRGHKDEVWRLALLLDNTTLLSGSKDGAVLVWDTTKTRARGAYVTLPKRVFGWRFAADSKSVLTVDPDGKIERWQGDAFQEETTVMEIGKIGSSYFIVVAPDCALVAVGSDNGLVKVWDWERRVVVREFKATDRRVYPVRFLARGKRLLLAYGTNLGQGSLHEWDLATGKETRSWPGPPNSTDFSCGVSPDERWCLMLGWEGTHSLIELLTGKLTHPPLNLRQPDFFSFSPEGKLIAAPSMLGFARIWDATTFREVATVSGFMLGVHSAVFSPDGHRLATGSNGIEAVKLWDVDSRENLLTLEGRGSGLHRAAFSPDGSTLGAKNWDGGLQFWRAPSWAEIAAAEKNEKKGSSSP
jgi:WD40 repeat protein